ncbi:hypothetical protein Tco_0470798 [Tanacetum coccineum]
MPPLLLQEFKLNLEPLASKVLKNKDAHLEYIKPSREHAVILQEKVESTSALIPLDSNLDLAYKYVQRIQEVLVYIRDTCPCLIRPSEKLVAGTPKNKDKKVRFVLHSQATSEIGRTFTIVGNKCPLTRFASTKVVPLKEITTKPVVTPTPGIMVYSRRPKAPKSVVQIVLWYLDSGCSKHMTENRSQLTNFVNKCLGTVKFGNDQIAKIIGYGDYQIRNVTISRVYYIEGLRHNLFSVGQFCDSDLEDSCHNLLLQILLPTTKDDWNTLLQPLFDEYFCSPPCVDHLVLEVAAPVSAVSTSSPSSTLVDQDAPSPSTSQTPQASPSHVIALDAKEVDHDIEVAHMDNNS